MWLVFGIGAIIFAGLNVIWAFKNKNAKWFRFFSLSLTYARFMLMGQLYKSKFILGESDEKQKSIQYWGDHRSLWNHSFININFFWSSISKHVI